MYICPFDFITTDSHTKVTFKALVDAILPNTPELANKFGEIQFWGALNLHIDEYLIWSLDHYLALKNGNEVHNIPLSKSTAEILNISARQLTFIGGNKEPVNFHQFNCGDIFASLATNDRFRAITILEQLKVNLSNFPIPFCDNPGFVVSIINELNRLVMFGYYSEWSGYSSTRLKSPNKRELEHFPISWKQVEYPGPSEGYHAMRGYLVDQFTE